MRRHQTAFAFALIAAFFTANPALAQHEGRIGTTVKDMAGGFVGTVTAVEDGFVTIRTDKHEVQIPMASTAAHGETLLIAMTRAELNVAADQAIAAHGAGGTNPPPATQVAVVPN